MAGLQSHRRKWIGENKHHLDCQPLMLSNVNNTLAETPCDSSISDNLGLSVNASDCDDVNERPKDIEQAVQSVPIQPMTRVCMFRCLFNINSYSS